MSDLPADLACIVPSIRAWAQERPAIGRLWLYGSRVRRTHRAESDLDIAVGVRTLLQTDSEKAAFWAMLEAGNSELSALCNLRVSLQSDYTPGVSLGIAECGVLIYEAPDD